MAKLRATPQDTSYNAFVLAAPPAAALQRPGHLELESVTVSASLARNGSKSEASRVDGELFPARRLATADARDPDIIQVVTRPKHAHAKLSTLPQGLLTRAGLRDAKALLGGLTPR